MSSVNPLLNFVNWFGAIESWRLNYRPFSVGVVNITLLFPIKNDYATNYYVSTKVMMVLPNYSFKLNRIDSLICQQLLLHLALISPKLVQLSKLHILNSDRTAAQKKGFPLDNHFSTNHTFYLFVLEMKYQTGRAFALCIRFVSVRGKIQSIPYETWGEGNNGLHGIWYGQAPGGEILIAICSVSVHTLHRVHRIANK